MVKTGISAKIIPDKPVLGNRPDDLKGCFVRLPERLALAVLFGSVSIKISGFHDLRLLFFHMSNWQFMFSIYQKPEKPNLFIKLFKPEKTGN